MDKAITLSKKDIAAANKRGRELANAPSAITAAVVTERKTLALHFKSGASVEVPLRAIAELASAPASAMRELIISPMRDALTFPALDVDIYIPGLLADVFDSAASKRLAHLGGSQRSAKKREAARRNGARGGRPKKPVA